MLDQSGAHAMHDQESVLCMISQAPLPRMVMRPYPLHNWLPPPAAGAALPECVLGRKH